MTFEIISESKLKQIYSRNLNSLIVLFAILRTNSVSNGARLLGISQPAASRIIDRLRHEFNDPLIIRDGKGITATSKARTLQNSIEILVNHSSRLYNSEKFKPEDIQRSIYIAANNHIQIELVPSLVHMFAMKAPKIKLVVQPIQQDGLEEKMRNGHIDIAIGLLKPNKSLRKQPLMSRPLICLAHRDLKKKLIKHKNDKLKLEQLINHPQIDVHPAGMGNITKHLDKYICKDNIKRNVVCVVSSFEAAIEALSLGIHICVMPKKAFKPSNHPDIEIVPLSFDLPSYNISVWWHNASNYDPLILWLIQELKEIAEKSA